MSEPTFVSTLAQKSEWSNITAISFAAISAHCPAVGGQRAGWWYRDLLQNHNTAVASYVCDKHTPTHTHSRRGQPTHAVSERQLLLSFSFSFRPDTRLRIIFAFLWLLCLLALLSLSLCSLSCGFLCSPNCLASCLFCALLSIDLYQ